MKLNTKIGIDEFTCIHSMISYR